MSAVGTLVVSCLQCQLTKDTRLISTMDPFCQFQIGNQLKRTQTHKKGGKTPFWQGQNQEFEISQAMNIGDSHMKVSVIDEKEPNRPDKLKVVGEASTPILGICQGKVRNVALSLQFKNKEPAGNIALQVEFHGTYTEIMQEETKGMSPPIQQPMMMQQPQPMMQQDPMMQAPMGQPVMMGQPVQPPPVVVVENKPPVVCQETVVVVEKPKPPPVVIVETQPKPLAPVVIIEKPRPAPVVIVEPMRRGPEVIVAPRMGPPVIVAPRMGPEVVVAPRMGPPVVVGGPMVGPAYGPRPGGVAMTSTTTRTMDVGGPNHNVQVSQTTNRGMAAGPGGGYAAQSNTHMNVTATNNHGGVSSMNVNASRTATGGPGYASSRTNVSASGMSNHGGMGMSSGASSHRQMGGGQHRGGMGGHRGGGHHGGGHHGGGRRR